MKMRCDEDIFKYLTLIFNFIFAVSGFVLLGLGVAALSQVEAILKIFGEDPTILPALITVLGVLIFLVALLGCAGAVVENDVVLIIFSVFTIQLLITKMALAVLILAIPDFIETVVELSRRVISRLSSSPDLNVDAMKWGFSGVFIAIGALELTASVFAILFAKHIRGRLRDGYSRSSDVVMMRY